MVVWLLAALFWHPKPSVSFDDAPSASPRPVGFEVFYELVATEAVGVRRFLGRPSELPSDLEVMVLLSPSKTVPESHREEMLDWVREKGGTLVLGHPFLGPEAEERLSDFAAGEDHSLCTLVLGELEETIGLYYVPESGASGEGPGALPPFMASIGNEIYADTCYGTLLLVDDKERIIAVLERYGEGTVIQLAEASILDNDALGRKRSHRFAAALIGRVGPSRVWVFNEAYEGIHPSPKFVQLVGASRWRPVFLQIVLMLILGYWQRTSSFGRRERALPTRDVREMATQARDIGDFYLRAQRSRYALSKSLEYLKMQTKMQGADREAKLTALRLINTAEQALETGENNMDKHVYLAKKMALAGQALLRSSKGKHHESV